MQLTAAGVGLKRLRAAAAASTFVLRRSKIKLSERVIHLIRPELEVTRSSQFVATTSLFITLVSWRTCCTFFPHLSLPWQQSSCHLSALIGSSILFVVNSNQPQKLSQIWIIEPRQGFHLEGLQKFGQTPLLPQILVRHHDEDGAPKLHMLGAFGASGQQP